MKTLFAISTIAGLAFSAPAGAVQMDKHVHHSSMSSATSTTPSVNRPGDKDLRSANKKGGTGGANSTSNGG